MIDVVKEGVELAGHPGEAGIDFSAEGFLRFIDPAVRIDQHGKRHNHSEGQRHHLGVGHLKTSLPRFVGDGEGHCRATPYGLLRGRSGLLLHAARGR